MLELTKLSLTTAFVSVAVAAPIIAVALTIAFTTAYIFTFIERKAMGELVDKINGSPHAKIAEFREKEVNEKSANIDKKFKKTEEEKTTPASADDSSASVQYDVAFEAGAEPENNPPNNETSIFATADIDDSGEGVCLTGMSPTN